MKPESQQTFPSAPERHGWQLYMHPAFADVYRQQIVAVRHLQQKQPSAVASHPKAKILRRIQDLIAEEIPQNPNAPEFLQGNKLGPAHRHWRRAKFLRRFRLFFRFSSQERIIVYAWINDEHTLRKEGAASDPYVVFGHQLKRGNPPDGWDQLLTEARALDLSDPWTG